MNHRLPSIELPHTQFQSRSRIRYQSPRSSSSHSLSPHNSGMPMGVCVDVVLFYAPTLVRKTKSLRIQQSEITFETMSSFQSKAWAKARNIRSIAVLEKENSNQRWIITAIRQSKTIKRQSYLPPSGFPIVSRITRDRLLKVSECVLGNWEF
jgi:hypothetical protein